MNNNKILVIGGAGFIGLNIVKLLCSQNKNHDITIADNFFRGKKDDVLLSLLNLYNIKIVEGDFTIASCFDKLDSDYDYVYMLASVVGVKYTEEIPNELIRINTFLIINTLEWIKKTKCKKILFTSTSECYAGAVDLFNYKIPTSESVPLCVEDISNPRYTYAVTKMLGESGFINYSKVYNFDCTVIRYHNVYGPRMGFKHVIPQVVQRFLKNENPFKIFGYDQTRSFNYIDDAVKGTILAMENKRANNEIFHIGSMTDEILIKDLVEYIGELLNFKGSYVNIEAPSGSVSRRCPDITKANNILGYSPIVNWKEGVKKTVEWYVDYLEGGKDVFE